MPKAISRALAPFAVAAAVLAASAPARANVPTRLEVNAQARAEGNRHEAAVALARVVLAVPGPAQILKVRVDGIGSHQVGGILIEGRPKHPMSAAAFRAQIVSLADGALARGNVEEVDLWAVVPIPVPKGAVVSGPMAIPTTKTVFAATFRRGDPAPAQKLRSGQGVYEDPQWAASLER